MKEEVVFLECQAWSRQAEVIADHFKKGPPILIEGRLAQDKWTDKETGKARSKTLVVVEQFEFCGDARGGKTVAAPASKPGVGDATGTESMGAVFGGAGEDDDIPFTHHV